MPDRDAAPAAAAGADLLQAIEMLALGVKVAEAERQHGIVSPVKIPLHCARVLLAAAPRAGDEDIRAQTLREIEAIADSVEAASRRARDPHHELTLHERALAIRAAAADVRAAAREAARGEGHS